MRSVMDLDNPERRFWRGTIRSCAQVSVSGPADLLSMELNDPERGIQSTSPTRIWMIPTVRLGRPSPYCLPGIEARPGPTGPVVGLSWKAYTACHLEHDASRGSVSRRSVTTGSVSRGSVSRGSVSKGSVSVSRGSVSRGSVSRGSVSRGSDSGVDLTNADLDDPYGKVRPAKPLLYVSY